MNEHYKIITKDNYIIALSEFRIPFDLYLLKGEHKANILSFRAELISAIKTLSCKENQILYGRYGSSDTVNTFFDVENILFYNIGTGNFKEVSKNGIAFSSFTPDEIKDILSAYGNKYSCIYEYSLIDCDMLQAPDEKLIAKWDNCKFCRFKGAKPIDYWHAIHNIENEISIYDKIDCNNGDIFGLDLTVYIPNNNDLNIASAMKPFLDGLICAFHGDDKMLQDSEYLMEKVGCGYDRLNNKLLNLLGKRQYLYKYRNNIKWNPADDLCKNVRILLKTSKDEFWRLSGKIYRI